VSHLWDLFPGRQINIDTTPELADAAKVTLDKRGDDGPGWSTAWKLNLWARLRDSARAYRLLQKLLSSELCYRNMFDAHPPLDENYTTCFQIDGNLGGTRGIVEMVVQNVGLDILLLPALPVEWPTGSIKGIRLRGAWTIDVCWENGLPTLVTLYSHIDGSRSLRFGDQSVTVKLQKGEEMCVSSFARP
jgi:alpha-L-fucosidase 2